MNDHVMQVKTIVAANPRHPGDPGLYAVACACGWAPWESFSSDAAAMMAWDQHAFGDDPEAA